MGDGSAAPIGGGILVQELQCEIQYELIERLGFETSEPLAECRFGNDGLRHGAVAARTADLAEVLPDELAGVSRVAKIPTEITSDSPTIPETIVHLTSSSCRKKSATYGMKSSRGVSPRNAQKTCSTIRPDCVARTT